MPGWLFYPSGHSERADERKRSTWRSAGFLSVQTTRFIVDILLQEEDQSAGNWAKISALWPEQLSKQRNKSYLNTGNGKAETEAPNKTCEEVQGQTAVQCRPTWGRWRRGHDFEKGLSWLKKWL